LSDVGWVRSLGGLLSRLGAVRHAKGIRPDSGSQREPEVCPVVNSLALRKFLSHLGTRPAPVLLDLGPVVGSNVTFFGEQLNCKVYIEDVFADLDCHLRDGRLKELPAFLSKRFILDEGAVDGVLLWDVYDYLDRPSAQALATTLVRLLRVGGALLGFFGSASHVRKGFIKYVIADESHVRQYAYASAAVRQSSPPNRDIIKMFDGLSVSDSFLLKNGLREILFRKGVGGRPVI
jgi:hypothetical protein